MKKIVIGIFICVLLTGCENKELEKNKTDSGIDPHPSVLEKDTYQDMNPIQLGFYLYQNKNRNRKLLDTYSADWVSNTDIGSFEVFLTQDKEINSQAFPTTWKMYYDTYEDIEEYRIGYHIHFELLDGTVIDQNLLDPDDGDIFYDYIQIYLYDDVHKEIGQWYSHVTMEEYTDETILSSIKLTSSPKIDEVKSPITLTVFSYLNDQDFKEGKYRGNSKYSIAIERR